MVFGTDNILAPLGFIAWYSSSTLSTKTDSHVPGFPWPFSQKKISVPFLLTPPNVGGVPQFQLFSKPSTSV
jgi:hypothetical protein